MEVSASDSVEYVLRGVRLRLPVAILSQKMKQVFDNQTYERGEANQIPRILRDGDRLLELGAGVGFLSALAMKTVKLSGCVVVEANPQLIPVIEQTYKLNGLSATVLNCVATSDSGRSGLDIDDGNKVPFYLRENFWGSSLSNHSKYRSIERIPVVSIQDVVDTHKPTVIVCDIEGGEVDLFEDVALPGVRAVFLEVHKSVIGIKGIKRLSDALAKANGLYYDPDCSVGATILYSNDYGPST